MVGVGWPPTLFLECYLMSSSSIIEKSARLSARMRGSVVLASLVNVR
jgi:hypothetical protein